MFETAIVVINLTVAICLGAERIFRRFERFWESQIPVEHRNLPPPPDLESQLAPQPLPIPSSIPSEPPTHKLQPTSKRSHKRNLSVNVPITRQMPNDLYT